MVGDGSRVEVDVDQEGVVRYVFREVRASLLPATKVRVEADSEAVEEQPIEAARAEEARTKRE
jgi:hypothetical protein